MYKRSHKLINGLSTPLFFISLTNSFSYVEETTQNQPVDSSTTLSDHDGDRCLFHEPMFFDSVDDCFICSCEQSSTSSEEEMTFVFELQSDDITPVIGEDAAADEVTNTDV